MRNRQRYMSDFETTSVSNFNVEKRVRVWAWNIRNIDTLEIEEKGIEIQSFLTYIENKDIDIFFHNLKFDGQFIVYQVLKDGFVYKEKPKKEKEFSCLIDECGSWYSIDIVWKAYEKRTIHTRIYDSFKKIPLSVKGMAKSYELEEVKGEIDYDKFREIGYQPTPEEWEYISNDTLIVAKVLKLHFENGMNKMTIASDAYSLFREMHSEKKWRYLFPAISEEEHNFVKRSYKGGFVWVNPTFKKKILENVISFDVNSLYPDRMRNCLLPYNKGKYFKGKYKDDYIFPLYVQHFCCAFRVKKDHIPCIQIKNSLRWNDSEYLTSSDCEVVELTLTNVDMELFFQQYDVFNIHYIDGYKYKGRESTFEEYVDEIYKLKQESTGGKKQIAKLRLNSLYGKFGSAIERVNMIPYIDENDNLAFTRSDKKECQSKYIPIASFITAYARYKTITTAQKFMPDHFIYADTDSIHLVGISNETASTMIDVDSSRLGAWKYEGLAEKAIFLRQKTYLKMKEGKMHVTCCGMPDAVKKIVNFDNFITGAKFEGKLSQKRVKGGVLLNSGEFTIKT